jgi:hypothetical protein
MTNATALTPAPNPGRAFAAGRAKLAFVHTGSCYHLADLADPAVQAFDVADVYAPDLRPGGLDAFDAVFLACRQHPGVMGRIGPIIVDFLSQPGRRLVIGGENAIGAWLPEATEEQRGTNFWAWRTGEDLGRHSVNRDHPLWAYLSDESVHWHYHGVLVPPPGATALVVLEPVAGRLGDGAGDGVGDGAGDGAGGGAGGEADDGADYLALPDHPNALLYHDDVSHAGELVAMTMDPSYHHGSGFMPGATQLLYRLLAWLAAAPGAHPAPRLRGR